MVSDEMQSELWYFSHVRDAEDIVRIISQIFWSIFLSMIVIRIVFAQSYALLLQLPRVFHRCDALNLCFYTTCVHFLMLLLGIQYHIHPCTTLRVRLCKYVPFEWEACTPAWWKSGARLLCTRLFGWSTRMGPRNHLCNLFHPGNWKSSKDFFIESQFTRYVLLICSNIVKTYNPKLDLQRKIYIF